MSGYFALTPTYDSTVSETEDLGAVSYPTSLDTLTNPSATDRTNVVSHSGQHSDANDAIEALEAKVGADGSAVTTSHDYKLSGVTGSDKAVSLTGTEVLTNKTLTSPSVTGMTATTSTLIGTTLNATTTIASTTITQFTAGVGTTTNLYTTTLGVGSDYITDLTGTGLSLSNGVLSSNAGITVASSTVPASVTIGSGQTAVVTVHASLVSANSTALNTVTVKYGDKTLASITYDIGGTFANNVVPISMTGLINEATTTTITLTDSAGGTFTDTYVTSLVF